MQATAPVALTPLAEEALQELQALDREDAFNDLHSMVEELGVGQAELAADAAEAQVASPEDEAGHARCYQRAGAHDAGLERHVKGGPSESVVAQASAGLAEGQDFGVRGGIGQGDGGVAAAAEDLAVSADDDGSYGGFARLGCLPGQIEGLTHVALVVHPGQCSAGGEESPNPREVCAIVPG